MRIVRLMSTLPPRRRPMDLPRKVRAEGRWPQDRAPPAGERPKGRPRSGAPLAGVDL
jgi:hypothetical protein